MGEEKKVFKSMVCKDFQELSDILASVSAREDVSSISFNGNISKPGDVVGSESRYHISWEEAEQF